MRTILSFNLYPLLLIRDHIIYTALDAKDLQVSADNSSACRACLGLCHGPQTVR